MTDEQKQAIYNYIVKAIKETGVPIVSAQQVLFYYLDHHQEIDTAQILDNQMQERKLALQKQIEDAQAQLSQIDNNS